MLKILDQRKQAILQWLQDPREISGDNMNNIIREASRYCRIKKREYLKDKINELATNRYFAFVIYCRENGSTMREYISDSQASRKGMIQLGGGGGGLYSIII
jgi:hypothetical protein